MLKFKLILPFFLVGLIFISKGLAEEEDYNDDEPEDEESLGTIISQPLTLTLKQGSTAYLPCLTDKSDTVVQWRRGKNTALFFDTMKQLQDVRYERLPNNTLKIKGVNEVDHDIFTCQILSRDESQFVEHRIFVESSAEIVRVVPRVVNGSSHTAIKGKPLTLACEAKGYPTPTVSWIHKAEDGRTKTYGDTVAIDQLSIEDAGEYICTAVNANEPPSKFGFRLHVQSAPEIKVPKDIVNSAERYESELICTVEAYPKAEVVWLRHGKEVEGPAFHIEKIKSNNDHILRISGTKKSDFGEYVCKAENHLGSASKSITLSGNPSKPVVKLADKAFDMSPVLEWEVESRAPITKYEINYKRQENSEWISVTPMGATNSSGIYFTVRHTFQDLSPGTYQARLKVKNSYGWSPFSDVHSFPGVNRLVKGENPHESHLLESQQRINGGNQLRISVAFILSLLCSRLLR